jgi:GT2 family glycosyltransferase
MKLGAVIVGYQSVAQIGACLDSCLRYGADLTAGIVVVDNASTDGTAEEAARRAGVVCLRNRENRGFAGAVNQGFQYLAEADAVLVLNPDVVLLEPPAVLARELADPRVAAVSGQMLGADGLPQRGFQVRRLPTPAVLVLENLGINRLWPGNPVNRRYRCLDLDPSEAADVEQPAGACLLVRRRAWLEVGGLDEGFYPVWFEDVDFCQRIVASGWRVRYTPAFRCAHEGGHSVGSISWDARRLYWYGSLLRYSGLHYRSPGRWAVAGSVVLGCVPRTVTGMFLERPSRQWRVLLEVVRLVRAHLGNKPVVTGLVSVRGSAVGEESGSGGASGSAGPGSH